MHISDVNFSILWNEALQSENREIYISEWATSSIWPEDADLAVIANKVGEIWDGAHMSARDLWRRSGLTQAAFAQRFCVPKRTIEDWCRGIASPPPYVRLLMLEALGIVSRSL